MTQSWFAKDFERMRDKWIATYGYHALCEDAGRVGVDKSLFPEVIEPKYRCKVCDTPMVLRSGKYGEFIACPKSTIESKHPTMKKPADYDVGIKISVKAMRAIHAPYMVPDLATRIRREYEDFSAAMGLEPMYKTDEECHGAIVDHDVPFIF